MRPFYLGECTGSGASRYITSADFLDPAVPVFRCSCPSHQFPCKHSLALLCEMMAGKPFAVCDIPDDILQKRAKKGGQGRQIRVGWGRRRSPESAAQGQQGRLHQEAAKAAGGAGAHRQAGAGFDERGPGHHGRHRAGHLPDPRQAARGLLPARTPAAFKPAHFGDLRLQKDGDDAHYESAIDVLEKLWALVKKSRQYLTEKVESGRVEQDASLLFEELGGVWKLSELEALGLAKQNARLAQLSFWGL